MIDAIARHAHTSPATAAAVIRRLAAYMLPRGVLLAGDDGLRYRIEHFNDRTGETTWSSSDGVLFSTQTPDAIGPRVSPDFDSVMGRWVQRLVAGESPADLVHSYPDWFV